MHGHELINRAGPGHVALETTLLVHGVPRPEARPLARELHDIVLAHGARPASVGVVRGRCVVGLSDAELEELLNAPDVPKANTSNLGVLLHRGSHAATSVSTTVELAARAGVRVFATGGLGGMHRGFGTRWDVSADLAALARFPVAVVASGVKSLLDVESTREALETLGVPVIGFGTDHFPAFYLRRSASRVDARFDDAGDLARFVRAELARSGRGIVIAHPIPEPDELPRDALNAWLSEAESRVGQADGRDATPALLGALHEVSQGRTLRANLALVRANAALAARVCAALRP